MKLVKMRKGELIMNTLTLNKKMIAAKTVLIGVSIICAVVLPQIFHAIGIVSGTGAAVGAAFLPMHIPVLIAGFTGGPVAGITAGIISPILSFAISGMPTALLLPFITIELAVYGLVSGLLSKAKLNSFIKLIITQTAGRLVRALAVIFAIFVLGNSQLTVASIGAFITSGLFGILIQWAVIPLLTDKMKGIRNLYE